MRLLLSLLLLCAAWVAPVAAQPQPSDAPAADSVVDPSRIVSLGGGVTEIVFALGAGEQVVGVDASSVYPAAAEDLPDVGYYRQVPAEGVLALDPTLVLASEDTGPPSTLEQLRGTGVTVRVIEEDESVEGAKAKIRAVAEALDRTDAAEALISEMEADLARAQALRAEAETTPRVLFVYARGAGTMMVGGRGTSADAMLALAGAANAADSFDGFKPMTAESVVAAAPEVILMLDRGLESLGGIDGLMEQPGVALTPAGQDRRVVTMDDLLLLGFGPRLGAAAVELTKKLHGGV